MNLQEVVQSQLEKSINEGFFEKTVKKQVESLIEGVTSDFFRTYSDFGKGLQKHIQSQLQVSFENVELTTYNMMICEMIRKELEGSIGETALPQIQSYIKGTLGLLEKQEWKLSEILEKFVKDELDSDFEGEFTLHIETSSYGYTHIYLGKEEDERKTDCEFELDIDNKGTVYYFRIKDYRSVDAENLKLDKQPITGSFDRFIFNLYASGAKVILDKENCSNEVYRSDY